MSTHADCRMYESKYPDVDDVVMVQVKSIAEMGAYVSLLEYNGIEGMILLSELSRRRIRSITKLIKVCNFCCSPHSVRGALSVVPMPSESASKHHTAQSALRDSSAPKRDRKALPLMLHACEPHIGLGQFR